jgi:cyanophycin synthetase
MRLEDARRLTGPNLYGSRPLVLAELRLDACEGPASVSRDLEAALNRLRAALSLPPVALRVLKATPSWVAVAFDAPLDEMLVGAELLEWAASDAGGPSEPKLGELRALLARDRSPRLPALEEEATRRGVPFLWDDELVSLGHGKRSVSYPRHELPEPEAVPWDSLGAMPVALVTGTNGKTTSTRLLARMVQEGGRAVGSSCSDSVTIAGTTVREGDWTGPAAARVVLRSPEVEVAVLETARGGILRRGLAVDAADVALLTNVSDDHLGGYGIESLDEMLEVKAVVARAVRPGGTVVLNARDARLVALAPTLQAAVTWFADLDGGADERLVAAHLSAGGRAVLARGGELVVAEGATQTPLLPVAAVPITFGGTARYNVENALGATAAAVALGVPREAIARALQTFSAADNPGRGEAWTRDGVTVLLDFAHNPEGVSGALQVARALLGPGGRLSVITGSAGDRSDQELETICGRITAAGPAHVYLRELDHYLRGRQAGEVPAIFRRALGNLGLGEERISVVGSELAGLEAATREARAGDVVALLVHVERAPVRDSLAAAGWRRAAASALTPPA